MSAETRIADPDIAGPRCPFCNAAWTEAMLDQYDALLDPNGCACCGSAGMVEHGEDHHHHQERTTPTTDLCCETCGKPIYRAHPASLR